MQKVRKIQLQKRLKKRLATFGWHWHNRRPNDYNWVALAYHHFWQTPGFVFYKPCFRRELLVCNTQIVQVLLDLSNWLVSNFTHCATPL